MKCILISSTKLPNLRYFPLYTTAAVSTTSAMMKVPRISELLSLGSDRESVTVALKKVAD